MEVYRGYMVNRIGATVLGGAINSISPTGLSQPGATLWGSAVVLANTITVDKLVLQNRMLMLL